MGMPLPPLLEERTDRGEFVLLVVVPSVFGLVTGLMLGVSEIVYLVLSVLGIAGGFGAGMEHSRPLEGFYRGLLGGLQFGVWILIGHGVFFDAEPKAELPDPEILLVAITAGAGAALGALGARRRRRHQLAPAG